MATVNERLPTELGWVRKQDVVTLKDILHVAGAIKAAASLTTDSGSKLVTQQNRRNLHGALNV